MIRMPQRLFFIALLGMTIIFAKKDTFTTHQCAQNVNNTGIEICYDLFLLLDYHESNVESDWELIWPQWETCSNELSHDYKTVCQRSKDDVCNCIIQLSNNDNFDLSNNCALNELYDVCTS